MPPTRVGANASGRRSTRAPIVGSGQRVEQGSESASSEWAPRCLRPTAWPGHSSRGHRRHAVFDMAAETLPAFARTTWFRLIGVMVRPTLRGRGRGGSPASSTKVPNAGCGLGLLITSAMGSSTLTSIASDTSSGPTGSPGSWHSAQFPRVLRSITPAEPTAASIHHIWRCAHASPKPRRPVSDQHPSRRRHRSRRLPYRSRRLIAWNASRAAKPVSSLGPRRTSGAGCHPRRRPLSGPGDPDRIPPTTTEV